MSAHKHARTTALELIGLGVEASRIVDLRDGHEMGRRYLGLDILAKSRLINLLDTGTEEATTDTVLELSA